MAPIVQRDVDGRLGETLAGVGWGTLRRVVQCALASLASRCLDDYREERSNGCEEMPSREGRGAAC